MSSGVAFDGSAESPSLVRIAPADFPVQAHDGRPVMGPMILARVAGREESSGGARRRVRRGRLGAFGASVALFVRAVPSRSL